MAERLESRIVLATWYNSFAESRYQDAFDVDSQRSTSISEASSTATENTTSSYARAERTSQFQVRTAAGGASVDVNARAQFAQSNASAQSAATWIVRGAVIGESTDINVTLRANGTLQTTNTSGNENGQLTTRVSVRMSDAANIIVDSTSELNHDALQLDAGWTATSQTANHVELEFEHTTTFSVLVGSTFSLNANLSAFAIAEPLPDVFAVADFSNFGGMSYSIESTLPGTTVFEFRQADDQDLDGVPDIIEDGGAFRGDGDGQGNPDKLQSTVATITDHAGNYVTFRLEDELGRAATQGRFDHVGISSRELNHANAIGPFDVVISQLRNSQDVYLRVIPHTTTETPSEYYHYGFQTVSGNPGWFDFPFDGTAGAHFQPSNSEFVIQLKDGRVPGDWPGFVDTGIQFTAAILYDNNVPLSPWEGDTDRDGVPDSIENGAAFNGDGNQDGTPDRIQGHVTSFMDNQAEYVTIELQNRPSLQSQFKNVESVSLVVPERLTEPALIQAEIIHVSVSEPQVVKIIRRNASDYLYYGPEANDPGDHWFEYPFDGRVGTQAHDGGISNQLVDNGQGDRDPTAGVIRFTGAAGFLERIQIQQFTESYLDANRNGIRDQGEMSLVGQPVYVDENNNGVPDGDDPLFFTNSAGQARITGLDLRSYAVGQINGPGMLQTQPGFLHDKTSTNDVGTARSVTPADVNDDGLVDLIVPNDHITVILLNQGDGTFQESDRLAGYGSEDIEGADEAAAVGYFNSDNFLDLAITYTLGGHVGTWFGNGDGTFEFDRRYELDDDPLETLLAPYKIQAADLTGEGFVDLVAVNFSGAISVLFGSANGRFSDPQSFAAGGQAGTENLVIANLDAQLGDTDQDIVVTNGNSALTTIFRNNGSGILTSTTLPIQGGMVAAGHFNSGFTGDEFLDLAIGQSGGVLILYGNAAGEFDLSRSQRIEVPDGSFRLTAIDFDRDGHTDLATVGAQSNKLTLLKQVEATVDFVLQSTMIPVFSTELSESPLHLAAADVDGDSIDDLVVATNRGRRIDILRANPFQQHILRMAERPIGRNPFLPFGVFPLESGSIQGRVWTDLDADGQRDLNSVGCLDCVEPYRSGVTVYLDQNNNGRLDFSSESFVQTNSEGNYQFMTLPPGTYHVRMAAGFGSAVSYPSSDWTVEVNRDQAIRDVDFGYAPPGSISGNIFYDTNANGQRDNGEVPLDNWLVYLDENNDGEFNEDELSQRTDHRGFYSFVVPAGSYRVTQMLPAGWDDSLPVRQVIQLSQSERRSVDFSNRGNIRITGRVWNDQNANDQIDEGESFLARNVFVDRNGNSRFDEGEISDRSSLADGSFEFLVPPGSHQIFQELQSRSAQTYPSSPFHSLVAVGGQITESIDFGQRFLSNDTTGTVWIDVDSDLQQEENETGAEGLRVYVDENNNRLFDPGEPFTHTDEQGNYRLLNADADEMRLETSATWMQTWPFQEERLSWPASLGFVDQIVLRDSAPHVELLSLRDGNTTIDVHAITTGFPMIDQITVPSRIDEVFVAELNQDEFPDLVIVAHDEEIQIWYALGNRDGTFELSNHHSRIQFPIHSNVFRRFTNIDLVSIGDDAAPDLYVAGSLAWAAGTDVDNLRDDYERIFALHSTVRNGHLVFESLEDLAPHRHYPQLPTSDLNGDDQADQMMVESHELVIGDGVDTAAIVEFRTMGDQFIDRIELLHSYVSHQVVDLDHDGDNDVIVSGTTSNTASEPIISFLENTPTGFRRHPLTGDALYSVNDVNNDGLPDLVLGEKILLQTSPSTFAFRFAGLHFIALHVDGEHSNRVNESLSRVFDVDQDGNADLLDEDGVTFQPIRFPATSSHRESYNFTVYPIPDDDHDGVPTSVEEQAPNFGDGNNDGVLDREQINVTSLPNAVDGAYLTIVAEPGTRLEEVQVTANPDPANSPPGIQFPFGFVSFEVSGLNPGAHTSVQIISHGAEAPNAYYKYGPTPTVSSDHFYLFRPGPSLDCATDTNCVGARIEGNVVTLFLTDGLMGDSDLTANGRIVDPGAMAINRRIPGDSNHDGVFNSTDFIVVFQAGKYEDDIPNNATFEEGDWDGDGDFTTSDLIFAFQSADYVFDAISDKIVFRSLFEDEGDRWRRRRLLGIWGELPDQRLP